MLAVKLHHYVETNVLFRDTGVKTVTGW